MQARILTAGIVASLLAAATAAQAQSLLFRAGSTAGDPASRLSVATVDDEEVVTGTVSGNDPLTLTSWVVSQSGKFTKQDSEQADGTSSDFVLVNTGATGVVSVVKTACCQGSLRLIDWTVGSSGKIARKGQITAGPIARLAAAAVGDARILTASQDSTGATKLIVWDLNSDGSFTRRGDVTTSKGSAVAVAVLSPTLVASAIRNGAGKLEVSTFSLDAGGHLAALGTATGPAVKTVSAAATAQDRVTTASQLADGTLAVDAWTASGSTVAPGGTANGGKASDISIALLGGVKAVTALRQEDGTLAVITWRVSDTVKRLDKIAAGAAGAVAMTTVGWDRIVTAVKNAGGALELIDWGDASVGMLRSAWDKTSPLTPVKLSSQLCGNSLTAASAPMGAGKKAVPAEDIATPDDQGDADFPPDEPPSAVHDFHGPEKPVTIEGGSPNPPDPPSKALALSIAPDIKGVDPMIAAGKQYAIVTEDHWIEFIAKTTVILDHTVAGAELPSKAGEATCLSSAAFFAGFTRPQNPGGGVNRSNINLYQRFPAEAAAGLPCDATNPKLPHPCINEFYDTRVTYDPYSSRFIILSAVRSSAPKNPPGTATQQNEQKRRYIAIAVSRGEDPRDGFDQWIVADSNYSDWPRMATGPGVLIVAHNACKDSGASPGTCSGSAGENVPLAGRHQRYMAAIFNTADMTAVKDMPRNWRIEPYDTLTGGTFYPLIHHGTIGGGWTYIVQPQKAGLFLWRFKQPPGWDSRPALSSAAVAIDGGMGGYREGATFQDGKLYFAATVLAAKRVPNQSPARYSVRGVRVDVTSTDAAFSLAACPSGGCLTFTFGMRDDGDPSKALVSYELPSMAVTSAGDMVVVHGRVPVSNIALPQEARYRVYYHGAAGLQGGAVLHAGTAVITDKFCVNNTTETAATAENMVHVQYKKTGGCPSQTAFQDYGNAFADPNGKDVWMALAFSSGTKYTMTAGKVTP